MFHLKQDGVYVHYSTININFDRCDLSLNPNCAAEKEIDKYTKVKLEKLSKKNGISIYRKDGSRKTKSQLFRTLKRKNLL